VGRHRLLEGRQPQLLRLSEQPRAIARLAEFPRQNSGCLKPQGAAAEIGRQPSASFQGCRGNCVRAAKLGALCRRFETRRRFFVRTGCCAGGVPGGTIRIVGECLGQGGVRASPLFGGCRLLNR